uniref:Dynein regulatory complex protein 1 n=1 Tax=Fundulus heteroclitus TaxID=8078 RepID=A0A3Q2PAA2_FUNHE
MEEKEERKTRERERESQQRRKQLQRDQTTFVTNTLIATDAKAVQQRRQQAKVQSNRAELLEKDITSSLERSDEILRRWSDISQGGIPEDLQKALNEQEQLYAAIIQDKKKIISDLQQKLKFQGDNYMKTLRSNAEEINVMTARMEDQKELVTKAYREELDQTKRLYQKEISILLTKDMEERDRDLEKLWKEELKRLKKRKEKLEEYKKDIHQICQEQSHTLNLTDFEHCSKRLTRERNQEKEKIRNLQLKPKIEWYKKREEVLLASLRNIESRLLREEKEMKKLKRICADRQKDVPKWSKVLSADYKRCIQKYERKKELVRHFAVADARRFQEVWLMLEAEVKQLAERALATDSAISHQVFGLSWKQPDLSLLELPSPIRPWKPAPEETQPVLQRRKSSQGTTDGSAESDIKSSDMMGKTEGAAVSVGCGPEWEEEKRSKEMQKEMMELLCSETDFLMEAKLLKLLAPLVDEEQAGVKLGSLLYTLGIDEEDLPQLTDFLLKYKQQQSEQTEETRKPSVTSSASELIHPNLVLPALKSFLQQRNSKRVSAQHLSTLWLAHARNDSKDAAYWESLGNIIPEEKVQMWDAAEKTLKQYHAVLTEISDLTLENERLMQKNMELRVKLNNRMKNDTDST